MRKLLLALVILLIGGAVAARQGVIVLPDDNGGSVTDTLKFFRYIGQAEIPIRVEGICISACTLVLSLPKKEVCITRQASFGFHLASYGGEASVTLTDALRRRFYPPAVNKWIDENGPLKEEPIFMSGAEVIAAGVLPECEE